MGKKVKEKYTESKAYSDNIMNEIKTVLDNAKIAYTEKSNGNELQITIEGQGSKEEIYNTIYDNIEIPKTIFLVLIDMTDVDGVIYVRQATK